MIKGVITFLQYKKKFKNWDCKGFHMEIKKSFVVRSQPRGELKKAGTNISGSSTIVEDAIESKS